ncbi:hypothetical protein [Curtobacterium herbarum]|uniref:Htaa domain-containing protein n=1 Tax=Curtobacterium herbarum TaxID=150122 RepID=A0ABN1ZE50_9MICO|nr:hypothetical protein [Curtobacterium herbarum]MBM7474216.1 hypothetical protein [Curtobacterium herbarum]MCS6546038.1 hypothetical protein [Curtobacterium herbarum]
MTTSDIRARRITTTLVSCGVAGLLALGAATPATAATTAPGGSPTSTSAASVAAPPAPGIDGIAVRDGRTLLVGTGIPGASVLVSPLSALARVHSDGRWSAEIRRTVTTFTAEQRAGGMHSSAVTWHVGDAPVPAGATPPAPATPERPVVQGIRHADGKSWLVGTGTPGGRISVAKNSRGSWLTTVTADGTWKIDVTNEYVTRSAVKQGLNGVTSTAVVISFNTLEDSFWGPEFTIIAS